MRAMQLIGEIEGEARGVYTGAIGFFSKRLTVFNVAIRTLDMDGGCGVMGAGSGIVSDSDAAEECVRACASERARERGPAGSGTAGLLA